MPDSQISILLPVHAGADPEHLATALDSIAEQTLQPDQVVIVEDGPLSDRHDALLRKAESDLPGVVRARLSTNQGAGVANQLGLEIASGRWVAKVDSDDINMAHRLATQLELAERERVDVCGAAMLEFDGDPTHLTSVRTMPASHQCIASRMRRNNPINHPTAFYRRELALAAGGYPPWRYMQDYGLFARMLASGARMRNLDEPLVLYRSGPALVTRRRQAEFTALERELQRLLRDTGIVGRMGATSNLVARLGYRRLPPRALAFAQSRLLARRHVAEEDFQ